jgi:hypothetical protein
MELSPGLHPLHGARAAEVITIAVFAEPTALAGELAGLLTFRVRTIPLPIRRARIRKKKPAAMTALSAGWRAAHDEPKLRRIPERRKRKKKTAKKTKSAEGSRTFSGKWSKKMPRKKTEFQTACSTPLSFRP